MKKIYYLVFIILFSVFIIGCQKSGIYNDYKKIAFAYFGPDPICDIVIQGYIDGLKEKGFIEGENLKVTKTHASGETANIPTMLLALENQNYDIIVPMSTPILTSAVHIIKRTNVVFVYTFDPIGAGVGKDFDNHLPNYTGVASFPDIKNTVELIFNLFPNATKIGTIYNPAEANSVKAVNEFKKYLKNGSLVELQVSNTNEVYHTAQALVARGIDVFWCVSDNTVYQAFEGIVKASQTYNIPLIINDIDFVNRGALAGLGINWYPSGFEAGLLAAKVLNGENPKYIPIKNVAENKIVVNHQIAEKMEYVFPENY
jgi:putative tryptophan/tyrosine transport system substrate-binding protein